MAGDRMLKLTFFESIPFAEDTTGTTVGGYEPCLVNEGGAIRPGRVIDVDLMNKASLPVDIDHLTVTMPLADGEHDLGRLLESSDGGQTWLRKFQGWGDAYVREDIPLTLTIREVSREGRFAYSVLPSDYFKRLKDDRGHSRSYACPSGIVDGIPASCWYGILLPPLKTANGWINGTQYNRTCASVPRTAMESYSLVPEGFNSFDATRKKSTPIGALLGPLGEGDVNERMHDFEGSLPLHHYLEVVYPVALRDAAKMNPLGITLSLKCT